MNDCAIVPHMTKVQVASVISRLPIVPFLGKKEKAKVEAKPEMDTTEPTTMAAPQLENPEAPPVKRCHECQRCQECQKHHKCQKHHECQSKKGRLQGQLHHK